MSQIQLICCNPDNRELFKEFYSLFYKYQTELRQIDDSISPQIETIDDCINHLSKADNYKDFLIKDASKTIGIVSYQDVNWLNDGKKPIFYIDHFYILPKYRMLNYGSYAAELLIENYSNYVFFLCALDKNEIAFKFWNKVIENNNCRIFVDERCTLQKHPDDKSEYFKFVFKKDKRNGNIPRRSNIKSK